MSEAWLGVLPKKLLLNVNGLYIEDKTRDDYLINVFLRQDRRQLILQFVVEVKKCSSNANPISFSVASVPLPKKLKQNIYLYKCYNILNIAENILCNLFLWENSTEFQHHG